jgi:hypothetical protein
MCVLVGRVFAHVEVSGWAWKRRVCGDVGSGICMGSVCMRWGRMWSFFLSFGSKIME